MKEDGGVFPVQKMTRALKLSPGRYYARLNSPVTDHEKRDQKLGEVIERICKENRGTHGSPPIYLDVSKGGGDNACAERFFATLKTEEVFHHT